MLDVRMVEVSILAASNGSSVISWGSLFPINQRVRTPTLQHHPHMLHITVVFRHMFLVMITYKALLVCSL